MTISSEIPFGLLITNVMSKKRKKSSHVLFYNDMMMYIKIDFFFPSYDQFTIQYPLPILHEWQGHCVMHLV
jgi:hypothetical protein